MHEEVSFLKNCSHVHPSTVKFTSFRPNDGLQLPVGPASRIGAADSVKKLETGPDQPSAQPTASVEHKEHKEDKED